MTRGLNRVQMGLTEEMVEAYGETIWDLSHNIQVRIGDPGADARLGADRGAARRRRARRRADRRPHRADPRAGHPYPAPAGAPQVPPPSLSPALRAGRRAPLPGGAVRPGRAAREPRRTGDGAPRGPQIRPRRGGPPHPDRPLGTRHPRQEAARARGGEREPPRPGRRRENSRLGRGARTGAVACEWADGTGNRARRRGRDRRSAAVLVASGLRGGIAFERGAVPAAGRLAAGRSRAMPRNGFGPGVDHMPRRIAGAAGVGARDRSPRSKI